jgi:isopentenyl-diphosphate delta-isomerase
MTVEMVVLVDDANRPIGTAPKASVHHAATPLHRAFSCFLLNDRGEVLLQQRARTKVTWPGVWSNSCCGHPGPDEALEAAVRRRLDAELGLGEATLHLALPSYRYRAEHLGVVEHEICPVFVGQTRQTPRLEPTEVLAVQWMPWPAFVAGVAAGDDPFFAGLSPWCKEETLLLVGTDALRALLDAIARGGAA